MSTTGAPAGVHELACLVVERLRAKGATLATAESCTGGMIAAALTGRPGSSAVFTGGVVAYDNRVKETLLGVGAELIAAHGVVSAPVVAAMAGGVRRVLATDYAVAVSGIAGPDGGSVAKPVGTVFLAAASCATVQTRHYRFDGDRATVRERAVLAALELVLDQLAATPDPC